MVLCRNFRMFRKQSHCFTVNRRSVEVALFRVWGKTLFEASHAVGIPAQHTNTELQQMNPGRLHEIHLLALRASKISSGLPWFSVLAERRSLAAALCVALGRLTLAGIGALVCPSAAGQGF